jgi:hypothetical protein
MAAFAKSWRGNGGVINRAGRAAGLDSERLPVVSIANGLDWQTAARGSFDPQRFSGALATHLRIEPKDKPAGPRKCRSLAETRPESDTPRA